MSSPHCVLLARAGGVKKMTTNDEGIRGGLSPSRGPGGALTTTTMIEAVRQPRRADSRLIDEDAPQDLGGMLGAGVVDVEMGDQADEVANCGDEYALCASLVGDRKSTRLNSSH